MLKHKFFNCTSEMYTESILKKKKVQKFTGFLKGGS